MMMTPEAGVVPSSKWAKNAGFYRKVADPPPPAAVSKQQVVGSTQRAGAAQCFGAVK
jgi:hypothetical protein